MRPVDSLTRIQAFFANQIPLSEPMPPSFSSGPPQGQPQVNGDARGGIDYLGVCEGHIAKWCSHDGQLQELNCSMTESGTTCGWVDDTSGFYCLEQDVGGQAPQGQGSPPNQEPESVPNDSSPPAEQPQQGQEWSCDNLDFRGTCDGNTAVWCDQGEVYSYDCLTDGESWWWAGEALGYYCLSAEVPTMRVILFGLFSRSSWLGVAMNP